ncbi:MAG: hypothetical protein H7201_01605 [Candidatus Saccharibacteria bacterium]|nr:hypothetical protein [Microbacteriaceae bacterium]
MTGSTTKLSGYAPGAEAFKILLIVEIIVAALAVLSGIVGGLVLDACGGGGCHYALSNVAFYLTPTASIAAILLTLLGGSRLRSMGLNSWWLPICGILLIAAAALFTQWLYAAAVNQLPPLLDPANYFS